MAYKPGRRPGRVFTAVVRLRSTRRIGDAFVIPGFRARDEGDAMLRAVRAAERRDPGFDRRSDRYVVVFLVGGSPPFYHFDAR